jgi:autotransporter-associated beta strand protein
MEPRLQLSAVVWTGAGGDNNWDNPANWNTGARPGSGDDVTINIAANVVHSDAVTDSINSLTSTQPLTLTGGTLSIASASSTSGMLTIDGGTLAGAGQLAVNGLLTLTAGAISGSGAVVANAGIAINPAGAGFGLDGRTLTNAAGQTATWTGTGSSLTMSDGAVFDNQGAFAAQNQGAFAQGSGAASSFVDGGTFTKSASSGELDFNGVAFNVRPSGTVAVQSGTLGLQGGGSETGASFSIAGGATLDFAGSTAFSVDGTTTFSGAGDLIKDGPTTLTLPGSSNSLTGPTTVKAGDLLVDGSQAASAVSVLGGATLGGTGTVGAVSTTGGTVSPGDHSGILNVQGDVTLDPSATFGVALDGPVPGTGYDQLNVSGAVHLSGSTLDASLGFAPSGQTFTIIRSTAPITGTFNGLPEGHALVIGGRLFKISYVAGNGDDVALTQVSPVLRPQILTGGSTTFTAGTAGDFTVESTGAPVPSVSESGELPSGVTFVNNGDGSATLAGTPAAGSGGVYHLTITAANGQSPSATQTFTLTVNEAPSMTSAAAVSFTAGVAGSFTLTTRGFPTATLNETGALPSGLTFVDHGNGTATLAGTPSAGTGGLYHLTITAANSIGAGVNQDFILSVAGSASAAPTITSAASTTFQAGQEGSFVVLASGSPTPAIRETGALPPGVTFVDNGNGTATLAGTPDAGAAGVYKLTITAANGVGAAATIDFTLNVQGSTPSGQNAGSSTPPEVVRLQRFGRGGRRTQIVLSFDEAMDSPSADLTSNYVFRRVVRGRPQNEAGQRIRVKSAVYDPANHTVTLRTARRLNLNQAYQIEVNGTAPSGLRNTSGVLLDGQGNGQPGSDLVMSFAGRKTLKGIPGPGQH